MAKQRVEANWQEIDPNSLPEQQRKDYAAYKDAYRVMKEKRELFELGMQAGVPDGLRMVLGYNFGKLSAAIVPDERKPAKATATKQSLADFIAAQAAQGRRA